MEPILEDLLEQASNWNDEEDGNWGRLRMLMLFEFKNRPVAGWSAEYEEILSPQLRALDFTEELQLAVVTETCRLVAVAPTERSKIGLLSTFSRALPWAGLEPPLRLLLHHKDVMGSGITPLHQLLASIDRMLDYVSMSKDDPQYERLREVREIVKRVQPRAVVRELVSSSDETTAEVSRSIQQRLELLNEQPQ